MQTRKAAQMLHTAQCKPTRVLGVLNHPKRNSDRNHSGNADLFLEQSRRHWVFALRRRFSPAICIATNSPNPTETEYAESQPCSASWNETNYGRERRWRKRKVQR